MKKLSLAVITLIILLSLFSCIQPVDADISRFINYWYEPIYNETEHGDTLESIYGYVCLVVQEDGRALMKSENYGIEGPYDWCINDDGTLTINGHDSSIAYIGEDEWSIQLQTDLITIDGVFVPCYSDHFGDEEPYYGTLDALACEA